MEVDGAHSGRRLARLREVWKKLIGLNPGGIPGAELTKLGMLADNFELGLADRSAAAMAVFVAGISDWTWFATLTCRPPSGLEAERGYTRRGQSYLLRSFTTLLESWRAVDTAFYVVELHESGVPHLHALLAAPRALMRGTLAERYAIAKSHGLAMKEEADDTIGWSKVDPIDTGRAEAALSYVCKYVVKGDRTGEVTRWWLYRREPE